MKYRMQKFMKSFESRIGNSLQPLYKATKSNTSYYIFFDDDIKYDNADLTHGDELIDVKFEEIYDSYLDTLDEYIGADIVISGRDVLPVLLKFKKHKQYAYSNPIVEKKSNPILNTRIYELEFTDGYIEDFVVNSLAANIFNRAESDSWDMGIINEAVYVQKYT